MADIMGNISGAFVASIWGLWLMLAALAILAIIDFLVQRSVADVDRTFAGHVVPELAALHQSLSPELSLGELLARTGTSLGSLNATVDGLTKGMADSLSKLGVQIREMLQDFGRFERHYVQLDGLLHSISKAGQDLQKVTGGLEGATASPSRWTTSTRTSGGTLNSSAPTSRRSAMRQQPTSRATARRVSNC